MSRTNTNAQLLHISSHSSIHSNLRLFPLFCWSLVCFCKNQVLVILDHFRSQFFSTISRPSTKCKVSIKNLSCKELSNLNYWNFDATFESIICNVLKFTQAKLDYCCKNTCLEYNTCWPWHAKNHFPSMKNTPNAKIWLERSTFSN